MPEKPSSRSDPATPDVSSSERIPRYVRTGGGVTELSALALIDQDLEPRSRGSSRL